MQFQWTLVIHLHCAMITCTLLHHMLSHLWAVESLAICWMLAISPWGDSLAIHWTLAVRRLPRYTLYYCSVSVRRLPMRRLLVLLWTLVLHSTVLFLKTSTLFQTTLSVSFSQRQQKVLVVCPFNSKALAKWKVWHQRLHRLSYC